MIFHRYLPSGLNGPPVSLLIAAMLLVATFFVVLILG